jgi:hypothetical protein
MARIPVGLISCTSAFTTVEHVLNPTQAAFKQLSYFAALFETYHVNDAAVAYLALSGTATEAKIALRIDPDPGDSSAASDIGVFAIGARTALGSSFKSFGRRLERSDIIC